MSKGGKLSVFLAVSYFYPRLGAKFDCAKLIRGSIDISGYGWKLVTEMNTLAYYILWLIIIKTL